MILFSPSKIWGLQNIFLGVEIARSSEETFISQKKYITDIVNATGLQDAKTASLPMQKGHRFAEDAPPFHDPESYRRLVGRLLYLNMTRPDISYLVQQLSQHVAAPTTSHWESALHIMKYLKGTSAMGLFYKSSSDFGLIAYSDSDWASCPVSRRSISGYCIMLGDSLISWKSKKQLTVSRSSCEAEYRSMASCVNELVWVTYLLHDLGIVFQTHIPFLCDNKAALHIASNPIFHERTKHIDIDCHIVRQTKI